MEVKITAYSEPPERGLKDVTPLLAIAALPALFLPTFTSLAYKWSQWTEGLSHGYLLIAIFVYLVYKALPFSAAPNTLSLRIITGLLLTGASSAWAVFALIDINLLAEFAVLGCLLIFVAHIYGIGAAWQHRFLLLLPLFAITFWDHLNTPLVNLSGSMVGEMVRLINIPAVIDGSSIFIPYGHIVIADGCSGLRYFIIALAMGYLISYLNGYSERGYLVTLLVAAVLALISNWLRIFILILVGYFTEMESSLMKEHDMFGWLLFAGICFPALYFAPVKKADRPSARSNTTRPSLAAIFIAFSLLSSGPLIYWLSSAPDTTAASRPLAALGLSPAAIASEQLHVSMPADDFPPTQQTYARMGDSYITINQSQRNQKGQKLVPYLGDLYNKELWAQTPVQLPTGQGVDTLPVPSSSSVLRAKGGLLRVAQVQWFNVGPFSTGSSTRAKLLQIPAILTGHNRFQMVTLRAQCTEEDCQHAFAQLSSHAHSLYTTMKDH